MRAFCSSVVLVLLSLPACSEDVTEHSRPADASTEGGKGSPEASTDVSQPPPPPPPSKEASAPEAAVEAGVPVEAGRHEGGDAADAEPPLETTYPPLLSQTGLYADIVKDEFAPGIRAYSPRYVLWSDGATKRRFLKLPPGKKIDTADMDYWKYPVGTKVFKEFTRDGKRIETRMLYKPNADSLQWIMISYLWREDLSDADAVPDGVQNARGTEHDIPRQSDCDFCHRGLKDRLLGVTAIQLSHDGPGMTLKSMIEEGLFTEPPSGPFTLPGTDVEEPALGYLHANCGHCHNPASPLFLVTTVNFLESTTKLLSAREAPAFQSTVLKGNSFLPDLHVIEPGRPDLSEMFVRMSKRGGGQMPPVATEKVDDDGVAKVRAWIESMPPVDGGAPDAGRPDSGAH